MLPVCSHSAIQTPIPLGNAGMCESLFGSDECRNPPKDVALAVANLRRHGQSKSGDVVKIGARAVPALVQLAGEKKMSLLVASAHAFALVHWHYPYDGVAKAALLEIADADPANAVFKRLVLGPQNWFQAAVWARMIDRGVSFTLPEAKLMFDSSFPFYDGKYGWEAILKSCLTLPPDQSVEAFVDALQIFGLENPKNMGEANWKRFDELLDAMEKTGSVRALYYLFHLRRQRGERDSQPIGEDWFADVFDRKRLPPSEANPATDVDKLKAAYDKRLISLFKKHRPSRNELEFNSRYIPNPGPEGAFWRLTRYELMFASSRASDVRTDVQINGKHATFEDGTDWKEKPVSLPWINPTTYSKSFSFTTVSTASFSAYDSLQMSVTDRRGKKIGEGRGMGTVIWRRKTSPWDPTDDLYRPDPRVKNVVAWDFHFGVKWVRDEPAYVSLMVEGLPLKDTKGVVWTRREFRPENGKKVPYTREFDVTYILEPPLGHTPQAIYTLQAAYPGEATFRIIGKPHKSAKSPLTPPTP